MVATMGRSVEWISRQIGADGRTFGGRGGGGVQRVKLENDGGLRRVSTLLF